MKMVVILILAGASILMGLSSGKEIPAYLPEIDRSGAAHEAYLAFLSGRKERALEIARPLAAAGDPEVNFLIGFALDHGSRLNEQAKRSRLQAISYHYRMAAQGGHPEAKMRELLSRLRIGKAEQMEEARNELVRLAESGDVKACRALGEAWCRGWIDRKADAAQAERWWRKAASSGDVVSLIFLACLKAGEYGTVDLYDPVAAMTHLEEAVQKGSREARFRLGRLKLEGGEEVRDATGGRMLLEIAAVDGFTESWFVLGKFLQTEGKNDDAIAIFSKGAIQGDAGCLMEVGKHHLARDEEEAGRASLLKASERGSKEAATLLAKHMLDDEAPDYVTVLRLLREAASEGDGFAQVELAELYLSGRAGWSDPEAAMAWFTRATASGDPEILYRVGRLHENGIGTEINFANAGVLYTSACQKGHAGAAMAIARLAVNGLGTQSSVVQAWAYAMLAKERGDDSAEDLLQELGKSMSEAELKEARGVLETLKNPRVTRGQR